jgi:hypothetical protein
MGTNVYCAMCEEEVGKADSFVVETPTIVQAFHFDCARQIQEAMSKSVVRGLESTASGDFKAGDGTRELLPPEVWKMREMEERLEAVEVMTRKIASVWRLWLNDAERGSINHGTFDAMKNLLGIEG